MLPDVNDEPESKFLYTETIKLYCIVLYCISSYHYVPVALISYSGSETRV